MSAAKKLTDLVGQTPLIRLERITAHLPKAIQIAIKAEWTNPAGSVKDRAAWNIVKTAMAQGKLQAGGILLDSSSGNTGIAYAMLGAHLGFEVHLCIPQNANTERKQMLKAYGAKLIFTDPGEGSDGAIVEAQRLYAQDPGKFFYADQYSNDANWQAHYHGTGPELLLQCGDSLSHFVAGLGTTGTCIGTGRFLREKLPHVQVVAFQPDSPFHGLEGMKHLETAKVPGIYDASVPHAQRTCQTEHAHTMARRLAREEGLLVGISGSAAVRVALDIAEEIAPTLAPDAKPQTIVALAPDGGTRYLGDTFWHDED